MTKLTLNIDKFLAERIYRKKKSDGFEGKKTEDWLKYLLKDVSLADSVYEQIARNTRNNLGKTWMQNLGQNLSEVRNSNLCLRSIAAEKSNPVPAVIVGGGPSIYQHNHLKQLKKSGYAGVIVSTDKMFIPCLREGLKVNYVISVDGHHNLIPKFYDDDLVEGTGAKVLLCLQTSPKTVEVCKKRKLPIYWFHTSQDNPENENSSTRSILWMTMSEKNPLGVQSIMSGGNAGATALAITYDVLKHEEIALVGFDYGYPEGTPAEKTSYYSSIFAYKQSLNHPVAIASAETLATFKTYYHPVYKTKAVSDPVFDGYRLSLNEMLSNLTRPCKIFNCTEGGTLYFPQYMTCITLIDFLKKHHYVFNAGTFNPST